MEDLSQPVESVAIPLTMRVARYWHDHRIGSLAVLPAVEALQILARSKPAAWGDQGRQEGALFHHLLVVEPGADSLAVVQEHDRYADGRCLSRLSTLRAAGRVRRRLEHLRLWFAPANPGGGEAGRESFGGTGAEASPGADGTGGTAFRIAAGDLYEELVPLGPAYRNALGDVLLTPGGAEATVWGGAFPEAEGPLGSPFPLDAAMHAACAWGQRYKNRVVFPVGFDLREIHCPTRAGQTYGCRVTPLAGGGPALRFDLALYGPDGRLSESVRGLAMREIPGGDGVPPAWVREGL
jgi:hypothetical protein